MSDNKTTRELCSALDKSVAASDPTRTRLECVINDVISDHGLQGPAKQSAGDFTRKELLKLFDHPKVSQLEAVLLKRITEDEARHILFFPDQDQAAYYQTLIANPPQGAPAEHPQRAVQIPHLSLLYLQHWKRWDFVSAFVLAGGLHTLCSLFTHDNPVVRLKSITTLVSITAHRDFDWFTPPPRTRAVGPGGVVEGNNTTEARLHRALLGLRLDSAFIPGLIANSWGGSLGRGSKEDSTVATGDGDEKRGGSFPGACLMCLELLAMWLSWVRALHTADGTLRLSRPLLHAIEEWAGKEGDAEARPGWDKVQWVPTLPGMQQQQQQSPAVGGDGDAAGKEIESGNDSADVEKVPDSTPEMVPDETGEDEGRQGNDGGTAEGAGAASGRAPACDAEAEAMMLKAEREEREKVVELVGKLVADFGRFPPAEQEWEEVKDGGGRTARELGRGDEGVVAVDTGSGKDGGEGADAENSNLNNPPSGKEDQLPITGGGGQGGHDPILRPERPQRARDDGDCASSGCDVIETSLSASTRKALALKVEGNESYKQGHLDEATEKYTTALGVLDATSVAASTEAAPLQSSKTSVNKPGDAAEGGEAAALLRGVLHRNRAAVALRLFELKATAAAAARDGKAASVHEKDSTGGGTDGTNTNTGSVHRPHASAGNEPSSPRGGDQALPARKGEAGRVKQVESTRLALESSLALLEECESDCLKAIEVDAGDKKARLRLERCRELRRRCYRGGLASAAAGRGGSSTNYSRQDERLQGRKADLVAKILARTEGSHEIVGGAGGGKVSDTEATSVSTAKSEGDAGETPSNSRGDGVSAGEMALADRTQECHADGDTGGGRALSDQTPLAADGSSARDSGLVGQGDKIDHAPWEGSELTGPTPNPHRATDEAARTCEKKAKSAAASKRKKRGEGDTARSRPSKTDAAAARRFRRRLEQAAARAAAVSSPAGTEQEIQARGEAWEKQEGWKEAAKEAWDVLTSLAPPSGGQSGNIIDGLSLEKLFGDGITAESLVGVAQGLRYAFGIDAARSSTEEAQEKGGQTRSNSERASQLFLELAAVKRVGLASAMCSPEDRLALKDVSDHVRSHLVGESGGGPGGGLGGVVMSGGGEQDPWGFRRLEALEAAFSTLGLQP